MTITTNAASSTATTHPGALQHLGKGADAQSDSALGFLAAIADAISKDGNAAATSGGSDKALKDDLAKLSGKDLDELVAGLTGAKATGNKAKDIDQILAALAAGVTTPDALAQMVASLQVVAAPHGDPVTADVASNAPGASASSPHLGHHSLRHAATPAGTVAPTNAAVVAPATSADTTAAPSTDTLGVADIEQTAQGVAAAAVEAATVTAAPVSAPTAQVLATAAKPTTAVTSPKIADPTPAATIISSDKNVASKAADTVVADATTVVSADAKAAPNDIAVTWAASAGRIEGRLERGVADDVPTVGPERSAPSLGADVTAPLTVATPAVTQTTATTVSTSTSTASTSVVTQVIPDITKVISVPGTHRLQVTLHPANLGEVRVTVVVRPDGAVRIDLASQHAAQALANGAPELRHMLDGLGKSDVTITVRNPDGSSSSTFTSDQRQSQSPQQQATFDAAFQDSSSDYRGGSYDEAQADSSASNTPASTAAEAATVSGTDAAPIRPTRASGVDQLL